MSLNKKSKLKDVLANPLGKIILEKYVSQWLKSPLLKLALNLTLEEIAMKAPNKNEATDLLNQIDKELKEIS